MSCLAIVGFHRSGTSMLAGILHQNGLSMGNNLLGASYSNPYGHFEDKRVIAINEDILQSQNGRWYNDNAVASYVHADSISTIQNYVETRKIEEQTLGFKDPRLMSTIRSWNLAIPELRIVYIHRGFERSCYSLWLRAYRDYNLGRTPELNQMILKSKEDVVSLYLNNVMSFLSFWNSDNNAQDRTVFIDYDTLLAKKVDVQSVLGKIGVTVPEIELDKYIDSDVISAGDGFRAELAPDLVARARAVDTYLAEQCVSK